MPTDARIAPAAARNREPILAVLGPLLAGPAHVVEVAAGSGEHSLWFARALPNVTWRPTDRDPAALASIAAWRAAEGTPNLLEPIVLDAGVPVTLPDAPIDALVCIKIVRPINPRYA